VFKWLVGILAGLFGGKYIVLNSVVSDDRLVVSEKTVPEFNEDDGDWGLVIAFDAAGRVKRGGNG
jgi:hypothetical protein